MANSIEIWETHRKSRVSKIVAYTEDLAVKRKSAQNWVVQGIKEWAFWAILKVKGPAMGNEWVFEYDGLQEMKKLFNKVDEHGAIGKVAGVDDVSISSP